MYGKAAPEDVKIKLMWIFASSITLMICQLIMSVDQLTCRLACQLTTHQLTAPVDPDIGLSHLIS